ncbi:mitochondrial ribosomal death-associated protein 3-domain-containing protein [Xylariaceae sp. FL0804]|nr:mitochondrial ribosomal death-associated protein 3-domain-containing protein [Xylariaceae sp. FL0804]
MASTSCWRCLARPSQRSLAPASIAACAPSTSAAAAAAFSTSTRRAASKMSDHSFSQHIRAGRKLILSKRRPADKGRYPETGERKAFRKRITLSNDNAIAVRGLDQLTAEAMTAPASLGRMMGIPAELVDQLRACEAFKSSQNWGLFRAPHMLIRDETLDMARQLTGAVERKETARLVITGDRGAGKSMIGLQAMATGLMNKWVVINIPEGQELTTASTDYSTTADPEIFAQPMYTVKLMQAIAAANQDVLSGQQVQLDHPHLPAAISRGLALTAMLGAAKDPEMAWPIFQAFWRELLLPGRPPVLLALDGLAHVMRVSDYRSPAFERIHSHDLGLVRLFVDALGGRTAFPNGAAVVAVMAGNNNRHIPSVEKALEQAAAAQQQQDGGEVVEIPPRDPFYRDYDERVFDALRGVRVLPVRGVSKPEARAILEYWAASGILRVRVDDKNVGEKWTMSGGGLLAEMERVSLYDIRTQ